MTGDLNIRVRFKNQDEVVRRFDETRVNDSGNLLIWNINTCKQRFENL